MRYPQTQPWIRSRIWELCGVYRWIQPELYQKTAKKKKWKEKKDHNHKLHSDCKMNMWVLHATARYYMSCELWASEGQVSHQCPVWVYRLQWKPHNVDTLSCLYSWTDRSCQCHCREPCTMITFLFNLFTLLNICCRVGKSADEQVSFHTVKCLSTQTPKVQFERYNRINRAWQGWLVKSNTLVQTESSVVATVNQSFV